MKYFATKEQADMYAKANGGFVCKMENHDIYVVLPIEELDKDTDEKEIIRRTFEVKKKDQSSSVKPQEIFVWILPTNSDVAPIMYAVPTQVENISDSNWKIFLALLSISALSRRQYRLIERPLDIRYNNEVLEVVRDFHVAFNKTDSCLDLFNNKKRKVVASVHTPNGNPDDAENPRISVEQWVELCNAFFKELENVSFKARKREDKARKREDAIKNDILETLGNFLDVIKNHVEFEDPDKDELLETIEGFAARMKSGIESLPTKGQKTLF